MSEIIKVAGLFFGVLILLMGAVLSIDLALTAKQCRDLESSTGRYTEWTLWNGCLVEVNDKLVPRDNWRGEYEQ